MNKSNQLNPLKNLKADIPASIVVFLVALPLCLGIAQASGAPLFSGLIAGIVGGIIVGFVSGSPLGVSGPAAGLAVIVSDGITDLGGLANGGFEIFLVSIILAGICPPRSLESHADWFPTGWVSSLGCPTKISKGARAPPN